MESDVSSGQLSAAQLHSQLQSQIQMRRGSFEDGFSVYTRGSSSDVDEGGYFYERR